MSERSLQREHADVSDSDCREPDAPSQHGPAPILVTGAIYITNSATSLDWPLFGLGICLIAIAAAGAFAGPRTVWLVGALAGGLAFWIKAGVQLWLSRT